jgi:hypothetical protein
MPQSIQTIAFHKSDPIYVAELTSPLRRVIALSMVSGDERPCTTEKFRRLGCQISILQWNSGLSFWVVFKSIQHSVRDFIPRIPNTLRSREDKDVIKTRVLKFQRCCRTWVV